MSSRWGAAGVGSADDIEKQISVLTTVSCGHMDGTWTTSSTSSSFVAHPAEWPLASETDPFATFSDEILCAGKGICPDDSVGRDAYINV